jgi:hypothetical protein
MALTEIPSELSSTPSIVDEGNSTAIKIDNSLNVMVGTTDSNPTSSAVNVAGQSFSTTGGVRSTVDSNPAATFNRKTDDGAIVLFRKDGTTTGIIGATASNLVIGTGSVGLRFYDGGDAVLPHTAAGGSSNGLVDLGQGGFNAFKDLYLSGGAYLGGTGAANKLEDYEEGDFTLVVSGGTTAGTNSGGSIGGRYTKIGRLVTCSVVVANTTLSGASGALTLTGFPFTPSNYGNRPPIGVVRMYRQDLAPQSSGYFAPTMEVVHGANYAVFVQTKDNGTWGVVQVDNQSGLYYEGTITYTTV